VRASPAREARSGADGYRDARDEPCKAIRSDPITHGIPIILVTTRGETDNMERGYENGCNDYVTKPVNSAELLSKVRNILGVAP
jgi:DNA-binding response OmpR family regulator